MELRCETHVTSRYVFVELLGLAIIISMKPNNQILIKQVETCMQNINILINIVEL